jgi:site-specific DNA-methyltransferase (adenine-specific)
MYSIIYADPPWDNLGYNKGLSGKWCPARHYFVMTNEQIAALPVSQICNTNAACFLWVTYPSLPAGLSVLGAWGFRYATVAFTWVKTNPKSGTWFFGCGNYTRANPELCLLGVRGTMKRISASVQNLVVAPRGRHSAKPPEVRNRIVELFGDQPRVELFARTPSPGWVVWGNEVTDQQSLLSVVDDGR